MARARVTTTLLSLLAAVGGLGGLALALRAAPAAAAPQIFHTILQDDEGALFSPSRLPRFIHMLRWLGVDELRVSAEWKLEAPDPNAAHAPAGFDLADPRSYDASVGMRALDRAVRSASAAGIGVIIDPAFSAPRWATRNPLPRSLAGDPLYNDDISVPELAAWEEMLARRYSGSYTPVGASRPLPRVGTFTLWNEPNQSGFLAPQWQDGQPVSADWYRALLRTAFPLIERASPGARILIGNTSPTGAAPQVGNAGVPPLIFLRRLACVDAELRPIDTGACAHFTELPAGGYAQHTYEYDAPPWLPSPLPGDAEIGDLSRLQTLLDALVRMHRIAPAADTIWITEQGYESNAQLPEQPWTEAQQAQLNADAEYEAWRDGHVAAFAQFLLRDTLTEQTLDLRRRTRDPGAMLPGTWTTGLEREDGTPKPALAMFRAPVVARFLGRDPADDWLPSSPAGEPAELIEVWGRARPMHSRTLVIVQASDDGLGDWRGVGQEVTDVNGIFDIHVAVAADAAVAVRFRWLDSRGHWHDSPETAVVDMKA